MIDIRKLKELVKLMVANDLTELDLRDTEEQVTLRRPPVGGAAPPAAAPVISHVAAAPVPAAAPPHAAVPPAAAEPDHDLVTIDSPMVGTFYAKPDPDAEVFVSVGSRIAPDTVVCLIEAMKIFNEIKAECSGTLHRMLVDSGEPVEFGQPLFEIRPD
ncbi:MAG: acetyl-CoA carboxylase biotin carboxyl carrier protein [Planctomycetota bacterium]|jgi:acetyl-CoA carboxylase biotin carboxyl carrier protein